MRIIELGKFYPPYRGGMETLLESFSEGFVERGAVVDVVVANDHGKSSSETIRGVRVNRCGSRGTLAGVSLSPSYLSFLRGWNGDLIHSHFPNPLADLSILLNRPRRPVVLTYHSDIIRQNRLMVFYRPILRSMLKRADVITLATPNHFRFSPWLQPFESKCRIIPFGIRLNRFQEPSAIPEKVRTRLKEKGDRPLLLSIGRLVGYKGHTFLIEAMKDLDAVLWIVGTGPLESELKQQAVSLGVDSKIVFWGQVHESVLPSLIQSCDIFVLPSITSNEAFGLVQIEAMVAGKPVISCDIPSGVPYVNQDGITGIVVPPRDSAALAQAVNCLMENPEFRKKCGLNGAAKANREYRESVMIGRYWQLFEELIH